MRIPVNQDLLVPAIAESLSWEARGSEISFLSILFGLNRMPAPIPFGQSRRSDRKYIWRIQ